MADIVRPGETAEGPIGSVPQNLDIKWVHGDAVTFYVLVTDSLGAAVNLTGYTPKADIKADYAGSVAGSFACTLTATTGQVKFYISSSSSAAIAVGSYIYDFQMTAPGGDIRTYLTGDITVLAEVTT